MTLLPTEISKDGFDHTQIVRRGPFCIYKKTDKETKRETYEVIRVQVQKAGLVHGKPYPEREVYPKSELWGVAGWSYASYEESSRKWQRVCEEWASQKEAL